MCPNCGKSFKRKSRGGCPHCKVLLFKDSNGNYRLESDKKLVNQIIKWLDELYYNRDKVRVNLTNDRAERKSAYDIIDRARLFMQQNNLDTDNITKFVMESLNTLTSDVWWYRNLTNLRMLVNRIKESFVYVLKRWKAEQVKEQTQERILNTTGAGKEYVQPNYSII